jgi:hypothetical protein
VVERYAYDMNGDTIWQVSEGFGHWESKDLEERCWAGSEDPGCRSRYGNVRPQ